MHLGHPFFFSCLALLVATFQLGQVIAFLSFCLVLGDKLWHFM